MFQMKLVKWWLEESKSNTNLRQKDIGSRGAYGSYMIPGLNIETFRAPCMH